jgi:predicted Zn-dependent peptidase
MTSPPAVAELAPYRLPPSRRFTLANGLHARLVEAGAVPKAQVRLTLRTGGLNEPAGKTGLAVLVSRYLKEGTADLDATALAARVAGLGGRLDIHVDDDNTAIEAHVLSEAVPELLAVLAEVAHQPGLPEPELPRLQAELLRELDIARSQPETIATERLQAAIYGDHPYARVLPDAADVEALTIEDVRAFASDELGARRASILVAGRFDVDAAEGALRERFEDWAPGPEPLLLPPAPRSERAIYLHDRPGAEQSTMRIGLPVADARDADLVGLIVTDTLLGGAFMSRITLNLREDKGYTYSPRSALALRYRDAHWVHASDVTTEFTGPSLHEIFAEIERLRAEPPPAEELRGVQTYVAGSFVVRGATPGGVLTQLAFLDFHELGDDHAEQYVERVYAVTAEDVRRIAEQQLRPEAMTIAIAGDASAIRGQIEPYGTIIE